MNAQDFECIRLLREFTTIQKALDIRSDKYQIMKHFGCLHRRSVSGSFEATPVGRRRDFDVRESLKHSLTREGVSVKRYSCIALVLNKRV